MADPSPPLTENFIAVTPVVTEPAYNYPPPDVVQRQPKSIV